MDYSLKINELWLKLPGGARQQVDLDLGDGKIFKLIGRSGLIFCRGPFCLELNSDARELGGRYIREIKAWVFPIELKAQVQRITRRACDLTISREQFFRDRHELYIVQKRLNEASGKIRFYAVPEVALIFFRSNSPLPLELISELKTQAFAKWSNQTRSWFASDLYADPLKKIIFAYNSGSPFSATSEFEVPK